MKYVSLLLLVIIIFSGVVVGGIFDYPVPFLRSVENTTVSQLQPVSLSAKKSLQIASLNTASCQADQKVAINLLLDTSGSMDDPPAKFQNLKDSTIFFAENLSDDDVSGVQRFSKGTSDVINIELHSINKDFFSQRIPGLDADGGTELRSGMELAQRRINENFPKYPDHKKVFIVVSDGAPSDGKDPIPIVKQIKDSGVTIISIGVELDSAPRGGPEEAKRIMRAMASTDLSGELLFYDTPSSDQLRDVFNRILQSICL